VKTTRLHLVHGWTYALDNWAEFIESLKKAGFEPIVHKVPGLTQPSDKVWTVDGYVSWLFEELGEERDIFALGHSNGGRILMAFDAAHPGVISKLILLDSAGVYDARLRTQFKRRMITPIAKAIKRLIPSGKVQRFLHRRLGARDYGHAAPNMRKTMRNLLLHDKQFELTKVSAPTTLIWGEHDSATPVQQGLTLAQTLKHVDGWHVIRNAGHSPQINHADEVVAIIQHANEPAAK
jgi:pimeloyl-ACP methyl ester carboxylesterase